MCLFNPQSSSGLHYNHSLWTLDGKTALFDPSASDQLSDIARYWIGGLIKHSAALTALCSPTVNCYRRLHGPRLPDKANWGLEDRNASFRVKNYSEQGTYFENRIPGGSCNPYLVLAATVAAGSSPFFEFSGVFLFPTSLSSFGVT